MKSKNESTTEVFPTAVLLKSKALSAYQRDFVKAILTEPEYTIDGAKKAIESELKKGV